ncbi:MAG TPA: AAA family ATPase [Candidatus Eisenbergiella pullistercoris]|uniref:AAA family ATPase n=1 Tax=Candidatus Eisenbergiella pullistercoris TaxID=2838555 RepID=A0A9D2C7X9_9FIRM|nr:AAA family ATPase [Candidatus Eisenbergiella pullistercoris]
MSGERDRVSPERKREEEHLAETLAVVRKNVEAYSSEVSRMQADIDEMLEHFHDNDVEVLTILNNTITLHDHMKRALIRNERALKKPYFGRIIFQDQALKKQETLYIGKGGISKDTTHWAVVDWRAPVANAYYENGLGKCSYPVPGGGRVKIDLKGKRTYEIEDGKLLDFYDSEVVTNDDLLTRYLAKNKQAVLGEIIATIQKEQNDIIRRSPYHNMIVQGVAGSGKTTVAMHRISYILYNYQERFKPEDFYIVGSNRILLEYITGVLPDLDVYGVRQMTMEQLMVRLLYEDWDEEKYRIRPADQADRDGWKRGTGEWFDALDAYCRALEWDTIPRGSIYLNPRQFVEGFQDGKTGVFDRAGGKPPAPGEAVELMSRDAVERYIRENPGISVQSKINMLNERLENRIREEFLGKGVKYTEKERKAILRAYRGRYGKKVWKRSIYDMYREFLTQQREKGADVSIPEREFDVYDLAALAYLYRRIRETEVISEAHHIVIDEAQDFGMLVYRALASCIRSCTYTIMGDVSQNIHFGYGLNDWEELRGLLLSGGRDTFGILKKSYRNTVEISEFAARILEHGSFTPYAAEPIIRHGDPVRVERAADRKTLLASCAECCLGWQKKGYDTIAVICRSREEAARTAGELKKLIPVAESDLEKAVFQSGVMVLPVEFTKGLEFDAVLILDPDRKAYPSDDGNAKLLYVAATRALHELCVLHEGDLTGLIADPVPRKALQGKAPQKNILQRNTTEKNSPHEKEAADRAAGKKRISIVRNTAPEPERPAAARPASGSDRPAAVRPAAASAPASPVSSGPAGRKPYESYAQMQLRKGGGSDSPSGGMSAVGGRRGAGGHDGSPAFGDMPDADHLRPTGRPRTDLAVRWSAMNSDGLYLQSRFGILRLCPVGNAVVRVTFAKGSQLPGGVCSGIAVNRLEKGWKLRDTRTAVEYAGPELCLQADRGTGAVRYLTGGRSLLLAERGRDCRLIEDSGALVRSWLYLDREKGEKLYAPGVHGEKGISLNGSARYISHGGAEFPLLLSEKGYGLLIATKKPVISCAIPMYGDCLCVEGEPVLDFYFIAGKEQRTIMNAYAWLCGLI